MKIIVHGNPVDGLQFIGPFPDGFDIAERHTDRLGEWWIASIEEPDRSLEAYELTDVEYGNLRDYLDQEGFVYDPFDLPFTLTRDAGGRAWAYSDSRSITYNLTNPKENN